MNELPEHFLKESSMQKETGYSLLELLGVTLVLAVVVAVAVPNLTKANRAYQLNASAQQIVQLLQSTRQEAARKNTACKLVFQTNNNTLTDSNGRPIALPVGVRFESLPSQISAPAPVQSAALNSYLANQHNNAKSSISLPNASGGPGREIEFSPRGLPVVEPGVLHWIYLVNQDGQRVAVTITSSGSTSILTYRNGVWS